jgi:hypothetical protein
MGGTYSLGGLVYDLVTAYPQYPVVGQPRNPFKLCDFPLVSLISLLY